MDVPIFGRISVLKLFRPREERKDLLFLLTERYKFCVLEFDETKGGQGSGRQAAPLKGKPRFIRLHPPFGLAIESQ